jgi:membrane protease YdiL (CAAX protease family)
VTEAEVFKKKRYNASVVFSCVTACVCLYLLVLATLEFLKINAPTMMLTQVINAMVFVAACIIYKKTDFTTDELGLKLYRPKKTIGSSVLLSGLVVAALMGAKLVILKVAPGFFAADAPFWNWNLGLYSWISYVFTCIIQEFLARSMIYGSIKKMFDGKHAVIVSILLSSLLFGAVHIAHGFVYMTAAMILLGALGGLYEKQKSIWGVTIIHYVLGEAAACLGFFA